MRASIIIDARDRASAVFGRLAARVRGVGRGIDDIADEARDADRGLDRMGRRGTRNMERLARAAHRVGVGIGRAARAAASWAATGALAAGAAAGGFFAQVIRITSQFEQFQIILEGTEGSAQKARQAMAWVQDFAKETPFELADVMEAYVALRSYGIDPTNGSLRALGDTASGMGKPVMQAVEMMADAMTGEFERLKEFGIRAEVAGDRVTFRYNKNGQEIVRTARNTASEVEATLTGIMNDRFGGMMERQSKTLAGVWSNIKDQASGFMLKIGQAGVFDRLKARAEAFLERIAGAEGSPRLQQWVQQLSDNMSTLVDRAFDFIENTDWMAVANGIGAIVGVLITVVEWIGKAASAWSSWQRDVERRQLQNTVDNQGFLGSSPESANRARRRLEDMDREDAIAAGRTPRYRPEEYPIGMRVPRNALPTRRVNAPVGGNPLAPRAPRQQFREPWLRGGTGRPAAARPQAVRVGGRMDVRVSIGPELNARLTRLETANRDVPVRAARGAVSTS